MIRSSVRVAHCAGSGELGQDLFQRRAFSRRHFSRVTVPEHAHQMLPFRVYSDDVMEFPGPGHCAGGPFYPDSPRPTAAAPGFCAGAATGGVVFLHGERVIRFQTGQRQPAGDFAPAPELDVRRPFTLFLIDKPCVQQADALLALFAQQGRSARVASGGGSAPRRTVPWPRALLPHQAGCRARTGGWCGGFFMRSLISIYT